MFDCCFRIKRWAGERLVQEGTQSRRQQPAQHVTLNFSSRCRNLNLTRNSHTISTVHLRHGCQLSRQLRPLAPLPLKLPLHREYRPGYTAWLVVICWFSLNSMLIHISSACLLGFLLWGPGWPCTRLPSSTSPSTWPLISTAPSAALSMKTQRRYWRYITLVWLVLQYLHQGTNCIQLVRNTKPENDEIMFPGKFSW